MSTTDLPKPLNRREVINLAWLASLGFFMIPFGGATLLFAFPRFKQGEFGGNFVLGPVGEVFPEPDGDPNANTTGKFWLSRLEDGTVVALYKVCTHLGCLYNWQPQEHKFICPCHGSQFELDGTYIQGPAPRSLDRFVMQLQDESGQPVQVTPEDGVAIPVPDESLNVIVDTGKLIRGRPAGETYPTSERKS